ncbi:alpha/beta hydrolase [Alphaproteobacteria bacterium]|nr:alpha/beta hydrolase [Alphaproteobacteria bacterium]
MKNNQKSFQIKINKKDIEVLTIGDFDSTIPVLILLHEGLGSVSMWRETPQLIHEITGLNILIYSRFGYGQSSPANLPRPLDYMTIEAKNYLPLIIKELNIGVHFLIGHSDGATIAAINCSLNLNQNLKGAALIAPHFFVENESINAIKKTTIDYENGDLKSKLSRYHKNVDIAFYGWSNAWLDPGFKSWDLTNIIPKIRVPIIGIQGLNDPYGTINQLNVLKDELKVPFIKKTISNCGHNPFYKYKRMTIQYLNDFFKNLL